MYEVKLGTRATRQVEKLDPHIKEVVKRRLRETLASDPHRYSFLSGKYSGLRRVAFSTSAGGFRAVFTIRENKRRVVVLFVGSRENFYKELQRYLG
jgi:mRNA-degrading endonuclease RelE of RelBE toxin-antitoxin system